MSSVSSYKCCSVLVAVAIGVITAYSRELRGRRVRKCIRGWQIEHVQFLFSFACLKVCDLPIQLIFHYVGTSSLSQRPAYLFRRSLELWLVKSLEDVCALMSRGQSDPCLSCHQMERSVGLLRILKWLRMLISDSLTQSRYEQGDS